MNDTKVEQSDVEEITNMIGIIAERVNLIRVKAFSLRNIAKPEDAAEKEPATGDFASEIKRRLNHIQNTLDEATESLARFAG